MYLGFISVHPIAYAVSNELVVHVRCLGLICGAVYHSSVSPAVQEMVLVVKHS